MKKELTVSIILLLFLYACTTNSSEKNNTPSTQNSALLKPTPGQVHPDNNTQEIILDTFSNAPGRAIDGCGSSLSTDSLNYKKNHTLFMSDLGEHNIIKINNRFIYLKESEESKADDNKTYTGIFAGSGYTVTIKTVWLRDDGEELSIYTGTLEISDGRNKSTYNVYGGIGC
jgi:hypothetical protein